MSESLGLIELDAPPADALNGEPSLRRWGGTSALGDRLAPSSLVVLADLDSLRHELEREFERVARSLGKAI